MKNIFDNQSIDQTSWSWLNLIGQKPSTASVAQEGVSKAVPLHNYFHNGRWLIDQVNEGGLYTPASASEQTVDGLRAGKGSAGAFTVRRITDPDNAALKCVEIACTTADGTVDATDYAQLLLRIEGSACSDLRFGTSTAEDVTVKFKYKTNVTGVYGITFQNSAGNRIYVTTFTALTTNEEEATITVPGDIAGTWLYADNTIGLQARIMLVAGTNYQGSALNQWQTSAIFSSSAQVNFLSSTSNIFYLKEIRIVKGRSAGGEQIEDKATALARCQRYFRVLPTLNIDYNASAASVYGYQLVCFGQDMASAPTMSAVPTATGGAVNNAAQMFMDITKQGVNFRVTSTAAGRVYYLQAIGATADCRL